VEIRPGDPQTELQMRPPWWKVFVSSKMRDGSLGAERGAAIKAVERLPFARAWAWERDATAGPYCSKEECVRQAGSSEALILILADEITSITRAEHKAAHDAGAAIFILLKAGAKRNESLKSFIKRARRRAAVTKNFANLGELRTHVEDGLREWTLRAGRSWMLAARTERQTNAALTDYGDLMVIVGEDQQEISLLDVVEQARGQVEEGNTDEALGSLAELADLAMEAGVPSAAKQILDELEQVVPSASITEPVAWLAHESPRAHPSSPPSARCGAGKFRTNASNRSRT
jgi:hypothetical protein